MTTHIKTLNELQAMQDDLTADYVLDNDIDASETSGWNDGKGFLRIGTMATPFTGSFDGQNHKITNLYMGYIGPEEGHGLFGVTFATALIKNLILDSPRLYSGAHFAGPLVGNNYGTIRNCYCKNVYVEGSDESGGLVGRNDEGALIEFCHSDGKLEPTDHTCGGFVGNNRGGTIRQCHSEAEVSADDYSVGGFSGENAHGGLIEDCYAKGNQKTTWDIIGGFNGRCYEDLPGTFRNCYSIGKAEPGASPWRKGGFNAYAGGIVENCFWDIDTSGIDTSYGGTGEHTAAMQTKSTFTDAGWNFDTIWGINGGETYPWLQWESRRPIAPTDLLCQGETNPTTLETLTPYFSAIYNDPDAGDIAQHYRIQVNTESNFSGTMLWDSGKTNMSDVNEGNRCENIGYNGSTLSRGATYYWHIKFWDDEGLEGAWSIESAYFAIATPVVPPPERENPVDAVGKVKKARLPLLTRRRELIRVRVLAPPTRVILDP